LENGLRGLSQDPVSPLPTAAATPSDPAALSPHGKAKNVAPTEPAQPEMKSEPEPLQPEPDKPAIPKAPMPGDVHALSFEQSPATDAEDVPHGNAYPDITAAAERSVALEGYCPVELCDREHWVRGDPRWTVVYGGQTFLFAGAKQQQRFLAAPARYSPAFAGNDPVLAVDGNAQRAGRTAHSILCDGRVYLFSTAATLARFQQNPRRYSELVR
jgi:YHS domain-containing protein